MKVEIDGRGGRGSPTEFSVVHRWSCWILRMIYRTQIVATDFTDDPKRSSERGWNGERSEGFRRRERTALYIEMCYLYSSDSSVQHRSNA